MKNLLYKINRWFELNLGWLFVNGRNQQWYRNYLKEKYEDEIKGYELCTKEKYHSDFVDCKDDIKGYEL